MPGLVPIALALWVVATIAGFARWRGRDAAIVSMIGGWALLPTLVYPETPGLEAGIGGSIHALAVATPILVNKATAIALGCLAGALLFDRQAIRRVRPGWSDVPILVFCAAPTASAISNGLPIVEGLAGTRYQVLAWGVPYALGRVYLGDNEGLRRLGVGLVLALLLYAPLCLAEFAFGPFFYGFAYGPHIYQWEGASRALGSRPLMFQEHGNQLGLWLALGAAAAAWLWRSGRLKSVAGLPGGPVAAGLCGLCVLSQSLGAILILGVALLALIGARRVQGGRPLEGGDRARSRLLIAAGVVLLLVAVAGAAAASRSDVLREQVRSAFASVGKTSFTWRLARYEGMLEKAGRRPLLGWGRADWSPSSGGTFVNPVNLGTWFHAFGAYGAVGVLASTAVLLIPASAAWRRIPKAGWLDSRYSGVTLAAVLLLICLGDSLVNSTLPLPLLAAAGGLNSWRSRVRRGAVETHRVGAPGHMRYRVATEAESVAKQTAGTPLRTRVEAASRGAFGAYAVLVVVFYAYLRWSPAAQWPPHLLFYGPRWALALPIVPMLLLGLRFRTRRTALALALSLVGFASVSGFVLPWRTILDRDGSNAPRLRVLTAHGDVGSKGPEGLAGLIRDLGPDVICFQDCGVEAARRFVGEGEWHVLGEGEFAFASRHALRNLELLRHPAEPVRVIAARAEVEWGGGIVSVSSVHLPSPRFALVGMANTPIRDIPKFQQMLNAQRVESLALQRWMSTITRPLVIAGDFNLTAEHPIFRHDWGGVRNAFSIAGFGFGPTLFNDFDYLLGKEASFRQETRIDHVLCGSDLRPIRCEVDRDVGSEHRPVFADFSTVGKVFQGVRGPGNAPGGGGL